MSNFGKRTLVLWYSTDSDYYDIANAKNSWRENGDDWIKVSEPFDVKIIERKDAAAEINTAKITQVDVQIATARELLEGLKEKRANLLAITHDSSTDDS